jgi:hypothetical protein
MHVFFVQVALDKSFAWKVRVLQEETFCCNSNAVRTSDPAGVDAPCGVKTPRGTEATYGPRHPAGINAPYGVKTPRGTNNPKIWKEAWQVDHSKRDSILP